MNMFPFPPTPPRPEYAAELIPELQLVKVALWDGRIKLTSQNWQSRFVCLCAPTPHVGLYVDQMKLGRAFVSAWLMDKGVTLPDDKAKQRYRHDWVDHMIKELRA